MNITEETNDYFSTTEKLIKGRYIIGFDPFTDKYKSDFAAYMEKQLTGSWNDQQVWNNLKDKLKSTPDRGIKRISKTFRVNWSKVFKRGWLLWE